jgi:AAA domain
MNKKRPPATEAEIEDLLGRPPVEITDAPSVDAPEAEPEPPPVIVMMTLEDLRKRDPLKPWVLDDYKRMPDMPWLVGDDNRPVLISRGLWVNFGLYKSGKTYFSLEQAFCIATGTPFNGLPVMQGRVGYICAEGDPKRIIARVIALCEKHGMNPEEVLAPKALNIIMSSINLIDARKPNGVGTLIRQLNDGLGEYRVIYLDTWAAMLAACGGHDSDPVTVMPAIDGCKAIMTNLRCTVCIVAHVGINEKAQDRPKGLSDLPGQVDGGTKCEHDGGEGAAKTFTFTSVIQRYAADGFSMEATMRRLDPDSVLKFIPRLEAARRKLTASQRRMLDILNDLGGKIGVEQWREAVLDANIWVSEKGKSKGKPIANPRAKWATELNALLRAGQITNSGGIAELSNPGDFEVA